MAFHWLVFNTNFSHWRGYSDEKWHIRTAVNPCEQTISTVKTVQFDPRIVEVRLLPRCVRQSSHCLLGRRPICPSMGSSNPENSSTLGPPQPQHRSLSPAPVAPSDRYALAAVQRTRQVHPQQRRSVRAFQS